ncbi:MAG: aminoglycoside phosphotransferase family protein [Tatlockia sp.]|nr:aminoglycoside phosphotransferase family protein [Tatlockia sp.]
MAKQLKLGEVIGEAAPLKGGALHSMFKFKTSSGDYAIKHLNPHITEKKNFQKAYELSETIAKQMLQAQIPAVCSLSFEGNHVIQIEKDYFIIYPFIEGTIVHDHNLTSEHAERIGSLYASMHRMDLKLSSVDKANYDYFDDTYWETLIRKAQHPFLIELLPSIIHWNQLYALSIPELNKELVITHRDMHAQNVLWDKENNPQIVDWESAGLMNPMLEVIGYGLEWSGIILHQKVRSSFFKTLITSYFQNIGHSWHTTPEQAFTGWLGQCVLAWTEFNIRRMIGEVSSNDSEIVKGQEIIEKKMIPCLNFIKENEQDLILLIEQNRAKLP